MPIYVYECGSCHEREEHMQSMSDPPKETCAKCGGKLERVITASAFHLKGGGWYKDGYGSGKGGGSKD
jgi:putative FmdB family regulatory protein